MTKRYSEDAVVNFLISKSFCSIGRPSAAVSVEFGISKATASKWLDRIQESGRLITNLATGGANISYSIDSSAQSIDDLNEEKRALQAAGVINIKTLKARRACRAKFGIK